MSRLIFLNLPPTLSSDTFRSALATPPSLANTTITDVRLVPKRRFAFVGYKSEAEAKRVQAWFDGTFGFGGGRVKVDFVRDEPLAKKPMKQSRTKLPQEGIQGMAEDQPGPSKRLQEFMDVMKGVDGVLPTADAQAGPSPAPKKEKKPKRQERQAVEAGSDVETGGTRADGAHGGNVDDDDDAAWLRGRQKTLAEDDLTSPSPDQVAGTSGPSDPDIAMIRSTSRLFVRNLPFVATSADLQSLFAGHGPVADVHVPTTSSGEPLGTAFVAFHHPEDAVQAYRALDKTAFQGRLLHVLPGRARPGQEAETGEGGDGEKEGAVLGKTRDSHTEVKGKKVTKRKEAGDRGVNWATLYMNSDAVAASVASRLGISKSDLLSSSSADAAEPSSAVKLALAETHVVEETKRYFADEGINLDSLQPRVPRSQTVLLVKNIPFGTNLRDLQDMFGEYGALKRCLMPPAGTLGVVEFAHAGDAAKAFRGLSYKRIGSAVIYLEKGPVGMFGAKPKAKEDPAEYKAASTQSESAHNGQAGAADPVTSLAEGPSADDEPASTLYIKNLAFETTTTTLHSMLSHLSGFSFARVQTKPDPKRAGERLSMGYGFAGFKTKGDAQKAMQALQGMELDGKVLEARFANRGQEDDRQDAKRGTGAAGMDGKKGSTKVLLKNLPFEAGKKEVRDLFSAYGTLKSVRVPSKPTLTAAGSKSNRGFAFLDFTTHKEAERAMQALKHTHLLGRHLVMQWVEEEEGVDVDKLRERAATQFRGLGDADKETRGKKRKFRMGAGDEDEDKEDLAA